MYISMYVGRYVCMHVLCMHVVGQLSSRTRHRVFVVAALVWFDDVHISAFHSCVVDDLWQCLSEWHLVLSACVLV